MILTNQIKINEQTYHAYMTEIDKYQKLGYTPKPNSGFSSIGWNCVMVYTKFELNDKVRRIGEGGFKFFDEYLPVAEGEEPLVRIIYYDKNFTPRTLIALLKEIELVEKRTDLGRYPFKRTIRSFNIEAPKVGERLMLADVVERLQQVQKQFTQPLEVLDISASIDDYYKSTHSITLELGYPDELTEEQMRPHYLAQRHEEALKRYKQG